MSQVVIEEAIAVTRGALYAAWVGHTIMIILVSLDRDHLNV